MVYVYLGVVVQRGEYAKAWTDSKWRAVPWRDGFLIPNLIKTYLCEAQNATEIC